MNIGVSHLLSATGSSIDVATVEPSPGETPVKVEKLLKEFKTHRSASDFAKGFITSLLISCYCRFDESMLEK